MSRVSIKGNASGTGTLTIEAPNTNTDRTIALNDASGTLYPQSVAPAPTPSASATTVVGSWSLVINQYLKTPEADGKWAYYAYRIDAGAVIGDTKAGVVNGSASYIDNAGSGRTWNALWWRIA